MDSASLETALLETTPSSEKLTARILFDAFGCLVGIMHFGYGLGVVNSLPILGSKFAFYNKIQFSLIASIFAIGGLFGAPSGGWAANRFGRKGAMFINAIAIAIGNVLCGIYSSAPMLIVGRVFVGFGAGANTVVVPLYLGEISPDKYRGLLGSSNQVFAMLGLLLSQVCFSIKVSIPS